MSEKLMDDVNERNQKLLADMTQIRDIAARIIRENVEYFQLVEDMASVAGTAEEWGLRTEAQLGFVSTMERIEGLKRDE